jgi:hypothetical protein
VCECACLCVWGAGGIKKLVHEKLPPKYNLRNNRTKHALAFAVTLPENLVLIKD